MPLLAEPWAFRAQSVFRTEGSALFFTFIFIVMKVRREGRHDDGGALKALTGPEGQCTIVYMSSRKRATDVGDAFRASWAYGLRPTSARFLSLLTVFFIRKKTEKRGEPCGLHDRERLEGAEGSQAYHGSLCVG